MIAFNLETMIKQTEFSLSALRVHDATAPLVSAIGVSITPQGGPLLKTCTKCGVQKRLDEFYKRPASKDGLQPNCRACCSDVNHRWYANPENRAKKAEAYHRRYSNPENRAKKAEANRRYLQTPEARAKRAERARRWYAKPENRAKHAEASRRYMQTPEGRAKQAEYKRRQIQTNPQFRLAILLRARLHKALKGVAKSARTLELLGCSIEHLTHHLESKFQPGMSWENHGEWHVDHIRPLASFDLSDPHQQRQACHWTNLQPLWAADNIRKHAKYETPSTPEGDTGKEVDANRTIAEPHSPGFFQNI